MKIIEQYNEVHHDRRAINIIDAKYIGDFAIRLTFDDGHMQLVDFKSFLEKTTHPDYASRHCKIPG